MPASKAQQAKTAHRRAQAIALLLAGVDYDTIADRLGYSDRGAATKDVWRALERNRLEEKRAVEELRQVEGARLDRLQAAVWPEALKGNVKAVETVRRLIAERIRLFGVAEPIRTEISGPNGGAVPLAAGTLDELDKLIGIAGDAGPDAEPATEDHGDDGD